MNRQQQTDKPFIDRAFIDHYRCPEEFARFSFMGRPSEDSGYFRVGHDAICYGRCSTGFRAEQPTNSLYDVLEDVERTGATIRLPFDPSEIIGNLRHERYTWSHNRTPDALTATAAFQRAYYAVRPLLSAGVRRYVQNAYFRNWNTVRFPRWPVDPIVEQVLETLLRLTLERRSGEAMPFVWFWPDGAESCAIMTHDVETLVGRDFCHQLMDLDQAYGVKSSFQIVPEGRYPIPSGFLEKIREQGFEIGIHDLNHDGRLFSNRELFKHRAESINRYGRAYGAVGFRSGVLYRNLDWLRDLDFEYDMSVPHVGHLEAQRGGCCTLMPFVVGNLVELPVTTTQDYSLFHVLKEYSIDRWKEQISHIMRGHGLVSFIVHPDYIVERRGRLVYERLLAHLAELKSTQNVWFALPREVSRWWRQRSQMVVSRRGNTWEIDGPGKERARLAWARSKGDRVEYRLNTGFAVFGIGDSVQDLLDMVFRMIEADESVTAASAILGMIGCLLLGFVIVAAIRRINGIGFAASLAAALKSGADVVWKVGLTAKSSANELA